ncbi:MAG: hypothetical protein IT195_14265, partial [Microthrixaceae bacterium]|nr:hypothetical protein [Microthrixaceae bacterium]
MPNRLSDTARAAGDGWRRPTARAGVVRAWLGLGLLLGAGAVAESATPAPSAPAATAAPRIAVLDFTMAGETAGEDWAVGAAELLEVERQQRGIEVIERRQIRLLLGERRLLRNGLIARDSLAAEGLPHATFFIGGSVAVVAEARFRLDAQLTDVQHGTDLQTFSAEGRYPQDWPGTLAAVATRFAVDHATGAGTAPDPALGQCKVPEAMSSFYQGLAAYARGQLEEAWTLFHAAFMYDRDFLLARAWELRTMDAYGEPGFAAALRADLLHRQGGALVTGMLVGSKLKEKGLVVWILQNEAQLPGTVVQALQETLQKQRVRFFSPQRVADLAREADLQISGDMVAQGIPSAKAWMNADALLLL